MGYKLLLQCFIFYKSIADWFYEVNFELQKGKVYRVLRYKYLRLSYPLKFINLWKFIMYTEHILLSKLYGATINNVCWKNLRMVARWEAYKIQNIRYLCMNFHRWMNSNRKIKRKNVCRSTLFISKINSMIVSLFFILLFHLLPSPVYPTGFSFGFFPGFLAIFILLLSNNNNPFGLRKSFDDIAFRMAEN